MKNENKKELEKEEGKVATFVKKYAYYLTLAGVIIVLALTIGLTASFSPENEPAVPSGSTMIEFVNPVANMQIKKGYNASALQYNKMLNEWSMHKAIDIEAESGANVMASYDGKIEQIASNLLEGTVITIDHGNNLKTVYKSLDEEVNVKVGDEVKAGQVIGTVSNSPTSETDGVSGVHFEVWKDNSKVDPSAYLNIEEK